MQQLTGIQDLYLQLESGAMPMHASSLTIYDRTLPSGGSVDFPAIQHFIAERASRLPIFRRRLVTLPLSLARPYWIEDPGFDIEFHVRHIALPKPGDWAQLCTQVARLHARPLDRNRPLWECYVIEELDNIPGLPRGSFALFAKAHCAALGETLSAQLFSALHELAPDSRASAPKVARYFDRSPTFVDLAARTATDALKTPWSVARLLARQAGPLLASCTKGAIGVVTAGWLATNPPGMTCADARQAVEAVPPQAVLASILSKAWEHWGARHHPGMEKPDFCIPVRSICPPGPLDNLQRLVAEGGVPMGANAGPWDARDALAQQLTKDEAWYSEEPRQWEPFSLAWWVPNPLPNGGGSS